jgi:dTDP-glucose pyrophosphorylase
MIHIRDLRPYLCRPTMSIRDAMARLNASERLFQLIANEDRVLLGTLTDGDLRRALLRGLSLDRPVKECMHTEFVSACAGADSEKQALSLSNKRTVNFVPIVDDEGCVVEAFVREGQGICVAHALIMAGGFGRRLGERTAKMPKPLLPIGGKPILDHLLDRLEDAGINRIHISLHYFGDQIRAFVTQRGSRSDISFVEEDNPLGTAGALARLLPPPEAPILVMNADVLTNVDVGALHDFHMRHGFDATVGIARYEVDIPFGVVRYGEDGLFAGVDEKPRISNFVAAGIYYLSPEFVSLVPADRPMDMPELLNLGRGLGFRIGVFPIHEYWTDIGRPDDLARAEDWHRKNVILK